MAEERTRQTLGDITVLKENSGARLGPGGDASELMKYKQCGGTPTLAGFLPVDCSPSKASDKEADQPDMDAGSKSGLEPDKDESVRSESLSYVSVSSGSEVILSSRVIAEETKLEQQDEKKEEEELKKQKELWVHMDEDTIKQRYERLKTLLSKSNLYTQYLLQRMERQKEEERKKREREAKKLQKQQEKAASEKQDLSRDGQSPSSSQDKPRMTLRAPVPKSRLSSPATPATVEVRSGPTTPKGGTEMSEDPLSTSDSDDVTQKSSTDKPKVQGSTPGRGRKRKQETQVLTNFFKPSGKRRKTDDDRAGTKGKEEASAEKATEEEEPAKQLKDADGNVVKPVLLTGGDLRPYQVEGLNWLRVLFENGVNGILADEMGLGKTIQCIAALAEFIHTGSPGPFLVVAPLSTLPNWKSEFQKFAPKIPTLFYHGSKDERAVLRRKIYKRHAVLPGLMVHPVVLTSYEIAMRDQPHLKNCDWNYLIVDEGHRIKNRNCRLIRELKQYHNAHRLLLTGTPLQNNLSELWSLLNFLLPEIFDDLSSFEAWFDIEVISDAAADEAIIQEEQKKNILGMLHQILTPFMLRRVKTDVDLQIPPKKEIMVFAPLSDNQSEFYKSTVDKTILRKLIEKNEPEQEEEERSSTGRLQRSTARRSVDYRAMLECAGDEDSDVEAWVQTIMDAGQSARTQPEKKQKTALLNVSLKNVMMMLRKVCNHPYLLEYPLDKQGNYKVDKDIVDKCGKMMVLDKMLAELKKRGHKVLIFSQMTRMLDILEDYMNLQGYMYCRLDGSTSVTDRKDAMDSFNNDGDIFVFLLSTRAGGLGINLTGGDTVIIYDSDWNPQNDLQAQDRCHRIGQTKPVMVYRLVTANTIDQKIVERAAAKRKLEKMVIRKGKFKSGIANYNSDLKPLNPEELMELLKSRDYQGTAGGGSVISEQELWALLDRTDMEKEFDRIKKGLPVKCEDTSEEDFLRTSSKESCKLFKTIDFESGGTTLARTTLEKETDESNSEETIREGNA